MVLCQFHVLWAIVGVALYLWKARKNNWLVFIDSSRLDSCYSSHYSHHRSLGFWQKTFNNLCIFLLCSFSPAIWIFPYYPSVIYQPILHEGNIPDVIPLFELML